MLFRSRDALVAPELQKSRRRRFGAAAVSAFFACGLGVFGAFYHSVGIGWIIRHNLFRNIVAPPGAALAGPAVLMWNHSSGTVTEGNTFINCARGVSYGLLSRADGDHVAGVIRNNVIFRASTQSGDVGIHLSSSPGTQVLNNTVVLSGTYGAAIEYRFATTTNVVVANNLVDAAIAARDGEIGRAHV